MSVTHSPDSEIPPSSLSSKRQRLTNYERASRLAQRIFETQQRPVIILYIGSAVQQYRLVVGDEIQKINLENEGLDSTSLVARYL